MTVRGGNRLWDGGDILTISLKRAHNYKSKDSLYSKWQSKKVLVGNKNKSMPEKRRRRMVGRSHFSQIYLFEFPNKHMAQGIL